MSVGIGVYVRSRSCANMKKLSKTLGKSRHVIVCSKEAEEAAIWTQPHPLLLVIVSLSTGGRQAFCQVRKTHIVHEHDVSSLDPQLHKFLSTHLSPY
jgi:hypothetical protein